MKVIFYVVDLIKAVLQHICMLCEHFRHGRNSIASTEKDRKVTKENNINKEDVNSEDS